MSALCLPETSVRRGDHLPRTGQRLLDSTDPHNSQPQWYQEVRLRGKNHCTTKASRQILPDNLQRRLLQIWKMNWWSCPFILDILLSERKRKNTRFHSFFWIWHCSFLFSHLSSIKSTFQLRTFDPEGAIFYGDTKDGLDWFVLSLKDGIPLMQISKGDVHVSVSGGPKLNDGKWHKVSFQWIFF